MRSLLSILVLVLTGFSAALLLSPDFYNKVRDVLPEDLSETISEGIRDFASDSDLGLIWTGLEEFSGDTVYAALETESTPVEMIGPFEVQIDDEGVASLTVKEGFDGGQDWNLFYYVDGNGNGICDEGSADVKRTKEIFSGIIEISMGYMSLLATPEGVCDHF